MAKPIIIDELDYRHSVFREYDLNFSKITYWWSDSCEENFFERLKQKNLYKQFAKDMISNEAYLIIDYSQDPIHIKDVETSYKDTVFNFFKKYNIPWYRLIIVSPSPDNLFFDLDIKINGDINFLADRFDTFTCIDSSPWKLHKIDRLEFRNDTLINTSIMRWTDSRKIFNDFIRKRDLYLRLYKGIDRYIYNEDIKYKTFQGTAISSWQEGIEDNTIVLYNNRYA